jgi:hypothetical protein
MIDFRKGNVVKLSDGSAWLVTDKASEDDLSVGERVTFIKESDFTANIGQPTVHPSDMRVFPAWQVVEVLDDVRL